MDEKGKIADPPPNPKRWIVLAASFLTMFTTGSMTYNGGVIHVGLLETFPDTPVNLIVWIGSIFSCMFGPSGPVASAIINLTSSRTCVFISGISALVGFSSNYFIYDPRWMILTYGILGGSCVGLSVTGTLVCLGYYFRDNVGLASGVSMCGLGLGMFVHPPLQNYMKDTYGMRGAFLLTGSIAAHASVFALLMVPTEMERKNKRNRVSGKTTQRRFFASLCGDCMNYGQIVKYPSFLYLLMGALTYGMATCTEFLYIPDFFQRYSSIQTSSFSLACSGIGSLISRLTIGIISKDENIGSGLLFVSSNGIMGIVSLFVMYFTYSTTGILLYGFLLGLYTGGNWSLMAPMSIEILDLKLSSTGLGLLMLAYGTGFLIGPPISNVVYELTGEYYHVFLFAATMYMISCVCGCLSTITRGPPRKSCSIYQHQDTEKERKDYIDSQEVKHMLENGDFQSSDSFQSKIVADSELGP